MKEKKTKTTRRSPSHNYRTSGKLGAQTLSTRYQIQTDRPTRLDVPYRTRLMRAHGTTPAPTSAFAAVSNRSSKRSTTLAKLSLKIPERLASTSTRGRPSSGRGTSSYLTTRPVASLTGLAPTSARAIATLSPRVLMASKPHLGGERRWVGCSLIDRSVHVCIALRVDGAGG